MVERESPGIDKYDQSEFASQEGKYQSVGHRTHHITAYIHSGLEEIFSLKGRIGGVDFLQR